MKYQVCEVYDRGKTTTWDAILKEFDEIEEAKEYAKRFKNGYGDDIEIRQEMNAAGDYNTIEF